MKKRICLSIEEDLVKWFRERFSNLSQAIEMLMMTYRDGFIEERFTLAALIDFYSKKYHGSSFFPEGWPLEIYAEIFYGSGAWRDWMLFNPEIWYESGYDESDLLVIDYSEKPWIEFSFFRIMIYHMLRDSGSLPELPGWPESKKIDDQIEYQLRKLVFKNEYRKFEEIVFSIKNIELYNKILDVLRKLDGIKLKIDKYETKLEIKPEVKEKYIKFLELMRDKVMKR